MTAAIISMIEKGKSHGGLPSAIELTVEEAQHIITEINSLRGIAETHHNRFKFKREGGVDARLSFLSRELAEEEQFELLKEWTEQKIEVSFDNIPLKIVIHEEQHGHVF